MTALKAGEEVQQLCPASGSSSRLELLQKKAGTRQGCLWLTETDAELPQTVWLSPWTDTPLKWNAAGMMKTIIFNAGWNTKGLSRDQDPAGRCCPGQAQGQNSKAKQLPGMQNDQDSWIQQSPGPPGNFPHWVRAQNEVAGIAHVLLAGLTLHTEREGRFMHCIPAWSVEMAKIIQIYFSPSNDFNRLLNKTSNPSPARWGDKSTLQFLAEWDEKQKQSQFPLQFTHIKFHQGWEVFLCCFHDGIGVFAVTGVLHSTVMENCWRGFCHCHSFLQYRLQREENTSKISLTIKIGTCLAKICLYCLHSLPITIGGLQKKK